MGLYTAQFKRILELLGGGGAPSAGPLFDDRTGIGQQTVTDIDLDREIPANKLLVVTVHSGDDEKGGFVGMVPTNNILRTDVKTAVPVAAGVDDGAAFLICRVQISFNNNSVMNCVIWRKNEANTEIYIVFGRQVQRGLRIDIH